MARNSGHIGEPGRIGVGVGVEVVEAGILHLVVALRVGQRVVGFAQVPLAGEEGFVAARLEHRGQCPFRRRQSAALALEGTVVMPLRLGMRPVCIAARPGVQLGWA